MSVFPTHTFSETEVKFRFGEKYVSESVNTKFAGVPRGVYAGYIPSFAGDILTLNVDPTFGLSMVRQTSPDDLDYAVDVITQDPVVLDFTGHVTFPVNVVVMVSGALGLPHSATVLTQTAPAVDPTELLLCVVDQDVSGPSPVLTVVFDDPTNRDTPFAYISAPLGYGFMKDGAVEELLSAIALTAEIEQARIDLTGTTQSTLVDRLEADAAGAAVADRLGREVFTIQGDDFLVSSTTSTVIVSKSFSKVHRDIVGLTPSENIIGFGSETLVGAVTDGTVGPLAPAGSLSDGSRNVCAIIDTTTEARITDTELNTAFGSLSLDQITLLGTLTFDGTTTVTGVGTQFTSVLLAGDIIEDTSGNFYEVATTPVVDTSLTLSTPALVTASSDGLRRRRFLLTARTRLGSLFNITGGTTIRFFFPMWRTTEQSQFDYVTQLARNHEPPPIASATTSVFGKALIANFAPTGQAGAVFAVEQQSAQVGPSHVHTVDFEGVVVPVILAHDAVSGGPFIEGETVTGDTSTATGVVIFDTATSMHASGVSGIFVNGETITGSSSSATATLTAAPAGGASDGRVDVTQRGVTGPVGPPFSGSSPGPGPTGPTGPAGPGIAISRPFDESAAILSASFPAGAGWTYQVDFSAEGSPLIPTQLVWLFGGVSEWHGVSIGGQGTLEITNIVRLNNGSGSPTVGRIEGIFLAGTSVRIRPFLNAGGF